MAEEVWQAVRRAQAARAPATVTARLHGAGTTAAPRLQPPPAKNSARAVRAPSGRNRTAIAACPAPPPLPTGRGQSRGS